MKKSLYSVLFSINVMAMFGLALVLGSSTVFADSASSRTKDLPYLHTQGNEIRDRDNHLVTLRGVNVGGWLVTERWMCGQTDNVGDAANPYHAVDPRGSGRFALEQLEARFGTEPAAKLMNVWYDNWFTTADLDAIQRNGFTLIRVPFTWRNLQDAHGNWRRNAQGQIDFSRFDWVVRESAKRHLYVIFVYHIWPGQQIDYGTICQSGEAGEAQRAQSAAIWSALAQHFRGNGTVAAFDMINEPTGSNDFYAAHRAFYRAIRDQDPERMLIAEWVNVKDFPRLGWTNTLCSGHYPAGNKTELDKVLADLGAHSDISTTLPCFIGEFKCDDHSNVTQNAMEVTQGMDRLGWSWASWTYKTVNMGGWGLFNYDNSVKYDLTQDTYASILEKWQTKLTQWRGSALPKNYSLKSEIIDGLKQGALLQGTEMGSSPIPHGWISKG